MSECARQGRVEGPGHLQREVMVTKHQCALHQRYGNTVAPQGVSAGAGARAVSACAVRLSGTYCCAMCETAACCETGRDLLLRAVRLSGTYCCVL